MPGPEDDPFAGYDLPAEPDPVPSADPAAGPGAVRGPTAARRPDAPERRALPIWRSQDFEVASRKHSLRCEDCLHHVQGGLLAIDEIPEVREMAVEMKFDLVEECKAHERDFEVRELEEIIEKAKTLTVEFDDLPRIRSYCIAGSQTKITAQIPEIKNHDGSCQDYFPGPRPRAWCAGPGPYEWSPVACAHCAHHSAPYRRRPSRSHDSSQVEDYYRFMRDPDVSARLEDYVHTAYQNQVKRLELRTDREQDEYDRQLKEDVREAILFGQRPPHGTLETCSAPGGASACAVRNRGGHCPSFRWQRVEDVPLAGGRRWNQFRQAVEGYEERVQDVLEASRARARERSHAPLPEDVPCSGCAHMRRPVEVDPFAKVHVTSREVMQLRDAFRRERKKREAEERRICGQPGASLGDREVPARQMWCERHSQRSSDGRLIEFAYCFRVLRALARDGECPSFESWQEEVSRREETACARCGQREVVIPRQGKLWCRWCSNWTDPAGSRSPGETAAAAEADAASLAARLASDRAARKLEKAARKAAARAKSADRASRGMIEEGEPVRRKPS